MKKGVGMKKQIYIYIRKTGQKKQQQPPLLHEIPYHIIMSKSVSTTMTWTFRSVSQHTHFTIKPFLQWSQGTMNGHHLDHKDRH